MRYLRKPFRLWLMIISSCGAVITILLIAIYCYLFVDSLPPQDMDLRIAWKEVPKEENGFELVRINEGDFACPQELKSTSHFEDGWDLILAQKFVSDNEVNLKKLDDCLTLPKFQIERSKVFLGEVPILNSWGKLVSLSCANVGVLLDKGKIREAFDQAFKILAFGRRIAFAAAPMIFHGTGIRFELVGINQVIGLIQQMNPEPSMIAYANRLDDYRGDWPAIGDSLKEEYRLYAEMLDHVAQGDFEALSGFGLSKRFEDMQGAWRRVVFHPNRTKNDAANECRQLINWSLKELSNPIDCSNGYFPPDLSTRSIVPYRNMIGNSLNELTWSGVGGQMLFNLDNVNARISAVRLLIGIRLFRAKHGEYPDKIEQIVPEFLKVLPIDPFDGKNIRYSRDELLIWSIGDHFNLKKSTESAHRVKTRLELVILRP